MAPFLPGQAHAFIRSSFRYAWLYFALVYGWSWSFWLAAAALRLGTDTGAGCLLFWAGGAGPLLAGIGLSWYAARLGLHQDFWRRLLSVRRIPLPGWLVIVLTAPLLAAAAGLLDGLLGGAGLLLEATVTAMRSQPWALLPFALGLLLIGPLPEEIGWRGYALDRMQARFGLLGASLLLGAAWSAWHLPLFAISGTYHHALGWGTLAFWLQLLGPIHNSVLITWLYHCSRRSILSAVLFHSVVNLTGEVLALSPRADLLQHMFWIAAALAVAIAWRKLGGRQG